MLGVLKFFPWDTEHSFFVQLNVYNTVKRFVYFFIYIVFVRDHFSNEQYLTYDFEHFYSFLHSYFQIEVLEQYHANFFFAYLKFYFNF